MVKETMRWAFISLLMALFACDPAADRAVGGSSAAPASVAASLDSYTQNSWKTMILPSCQSFFDGCNNCVRRADAKQLTCTRKACMVYQQPRCLDPQLPQMQNIEYHCAEGVFIVYLGQYGEDDERVVLEPGNVMFVDRQTGEELLLQREVSGSGEKYAGGGLVYWNKGDNAIVHKNDAPLYRECVSSQVNDELLSQ